MSRCACTWILLLTAVAGCATHTDRVRPARDLYFRGQAEQAAVELERLLPRAGKESDVAELDLAMARLFSGRPAEAEQTLRQVRDRFDYLEQKDISETVLSYVTDDNQRAYAGEDYEKILLRVTLALANLMGDGGDAEAYSLQVNAKQQQIIEAGADLDEQNPKGNYPRVAVGAYLHGVLREATHGNYDDAERAFATVVSWQPDFPAGGFDLQRVRQGAHSAPGNGVLYVFAFVGRGPYKREVSEIPTSQAMLIADRIISAVGKHSIPPTLAPIKVPQLVTSENRLDRLLVEVDGEPVGATATVTDVGQLAVQQYQAIYPHILGRAVARRAVKKAAVYAVKEQVDGLNVWASLAMDAAGVVWEATESADTRCWALLPDKIQVLRVELPAGRHCVALRPAQGQIPVGGQTQVTVPVEDGRNCYALACCPDTHFAGQILVSGR